MEQVNVTLTETIKLLQADSNSNANQAAAN